MSWTVRTAGKFKVPAVHFDGATALICSALAASSANCVTYSFWCKLAPSTDDVPMWVVAPQSVDPLIASNAQDVCNGHGGDYAYGCRATSIEASPGPSYGAAMSVDSNALLSAEYWHHVLGQMFPDFSGHPKPGAMFIDDTDQTFVDTFGSLNPDAPFLIGCAGQPFYIGGDGFSYLVCDLAEFWWALGQNPDLTVEENRRKFISASGRPVPLGANGELPTGTPPTIYGHGGKDKFLQPNLGTGGEFTLTGTLTNADSEPKLSNE